MQLLKTEEAIQSALALYPVLETNKMGEYYNSVGFWPGTTTPFLKSFGSFRFDLYEQTDLFFQNAALYIKNDIFHLIIDQEIKYSYKLSRSKKDGKHLQVKYILNQDRTKLYFVNTHDFLLYCCDTSKMRQFVMLHNASTWQEYENELSKMATVSHPLYKKFIDLAKKHKNAYHGLYVGKPRVFLEKIDQYPINFYQKISAIIEMPKKFSINLSSINNKIDERKKSFLHFGTNR